MAAGYVYTIKEPPKMEERQVILKLPRATWDVIDRLVQEHGDEGTEHVIEACVMYAIEVRLRQVEGSK